MDIRLKRTPAFLITKKRQDQHCKGAMYCNHGAMYEVKKNGTRNPVPDI